MFGSNKHTHTTTAGTGTTTGNTGFLSGLRRSNRTAATTNKPVYTSSRNSRTTGTGMGTGTGSSGIRRKKKTVATGPAPMSHHNTKPTVGQKVHGATTVMKGKLHNDHREVRAGEKEMQGQKSGGFLGMGSSNTGTNARRI